MSETKSLTWQITQAEIAELNAKAAVLEATQNKSELKERLKAQKEAQKKGGAK